MSFKTIVTLLMLSCLSATGAALGLTGRPSQEEGVVASYYRSPSLIDLVIKEVHWFMEETSTTVHVCAADVLDGDTVKLVYRYGTDQTFNVDGVVDSSDTRCAIFTTVAIYKIDEKRARYQLLVIDTSDPTVIIERGSTTLVITVITTLLTCGGSHITKVTWSESEVLSKDFTCIASTADSDKACYHDGDITGEEFCFVVKDEKNLDVKVCLNAPIYNRPNSNDPISSNFFFYGPEAVNTVKADATLSLTVTILGLSQMRAIVREARGLLSPEAAPVAQDLLPTPGAHVYSCSTTDCTFPSHERKLVTYEVCLDAMKENLETIKTMTTTFTDLNLHAFDAGFQKSMLLECVFANALPGMKYTAKLLDKLPEVGVDVIPLSTSHIDCTGVSPDHACFGYLNADSAPATLLYVTVSADTDTFNTIIAPFIIP